MPQNLVRDAPVDGDDELSLPKIRGREDSVVDSVGQRVVLRIRPPITTEHSEDRSRLSPKGNCQLWVEDKIDIPLGHDNADRDLVPENGRLSDG